MLNWQREEENRRGLTGRLVVPLLVAALLTTGSATTSLAQQSATPKEQYEEAERLRKGNGGAPDLERALALHTALADQGYEKSLVRVASIHEHLGNAALAIDYFEQAAETGSTYARMRLAQGHAAGKFGDLSQPTVGFADLKTLAETTDNLLVDYQLARAYEVGYGTPADLDRAKELYKSLSEQGHGMSAARLASIYVSHEEGERADLQTAIEQYRHAAENGYDYALIGLARSLIQAGQGSAALEVIETAVSKGVGDAESRRAIWHHSGDFGNKSDRRLGRSELVRLSESGNVYAARHVLRLHERRSQRLTELDLTLVLAKQEENMKAGNRMATEALARAYRELSWLIPGARSKHIQLTEDYGHQMGIRQRVPEQLEALYDPRHGPTSRRKAYAFLREVKDEGYVHGLVRLRSIDRRAYVYVVQKELTALGYYYGPTNAYLMSSTIVAIARFCRDEGIQHICQHGPMTYDSAVAISRSLHRRQAQSF